MKELSDIQVMAALNLAKNPLIQKVEVEVDHNGLSRITIKSAVDAEWNGVDGVDMAVSLALDEVFPGLEYYGKPVTYPTITDDTDTELYFINWQGEKLIDLHMKMTPTANRSQDGNISEIDHITSIWTTKEIMRNEA